MSVLIVILAALAGAALAVWLVRRRENGDATQRLDERLRLRDELKSISVDVLAHTGESLARRLEDQRRAEQERAAGEMASRSEEIKGLVRPVQEKLGRMESEIGRLERERRQAQGELSLSEAASCPSWVNANTAIWFDYDSDGLLDLFVGGYYPEDVDLWHLKSTRMMPDSFEYAKNGGRKYLFHNLGNGRFEEVSAKVGIDSRRWSLAATAADLRGSGHQDLFVANDTMPNFLFINKGNGKFEEVGLAAGVAFSDMGKPRSGMGVDAADFDGDGWQDLFVANIDREFFSLYHNQKGLIFTDEPGEIGTATQMLSGWGLRFFDYDNDGDPDLFLVNGHPDDFIEMRTTRVKYKEPLLMFENTGRAFKNVSAQSGAVFSKDFSGRGMATGDFDNDGDLDVLISNNGEPPLLLRNEGGNKNNWLGLQLVATKSNPAAAGAVITWQAGGVKRSRLKTAGGSYLSSHDPREILGLGAATKIESVQIRWPSGTVDTLVNLQINRYLKVVEGRGIVTTTARK